MALLLWARRSAIPAEPKATLVSSFQAEMERLEVRCHPTDVCALLQRAQEAVASQAAQRDITFSVDSPEEPVVIPTDPPMAEQVLTNILSRAVVQARQGALRLGLTAEEKQACLTLRYTTDPQAAQAPAVDDTIVQLADRLRWQIQQVEEPEDSVVIDLTIRPSSPIVLIIDDNEGLVNLLKRYLADHACQVIAAMDGQEGMQLAHETIPDAIVLDVMMPGMQGWEVLQKLHNDPRTVNVPIVVCSVIANPDLANSLGASLFLPKPVRREDVLNALRELGVV